MLKIRTFINICFSLYLAFALVGCSSVRGLITGSEVEDPDKVSPTPDFSMSAAPAIEPTSIFSLNNSGISAIGVVVPAQEANLSFATNGRIIEIYVKEGDYVQQGDLLAQLDDSQQLIALASAKVKLAAAEAELDAINSGASPEKLVLVQADLTKAEAQLSKLLNGPTTEQIAEAEAQVEIAKAELSNLLAGPKPEELNALLAQLQQVEVDLAAAQSEYDKVAFMADIGSHPAAIQLQRRTIAYEQVKSKYAAVASGPTETEVAIAEARVRSAEASFARAKAPVAPEDILQAQATVAQAEARLSELEAGATELEKDLIGIKIEAAKIDLEQAQIEIGKTQLIAPFSGVVASIGPNAGELIAQGADVILLGDTSSWYAVTTELNEYDVAEFNEGDSVSLNIDALPETNFRGVVDTISPISEGALRQFQKGAEANYRLSVSILEGDFDVLRWGMTINLNIEADTF